MASTSELGTGLGGWSAFFGAFDDIVLVANSDAVDIADLDRRFGEKTLFVFFNKVYKVLDQAFVRPSILVARSSEAGANIVYRREVEDVVRLLAEPGFRGILNLRVAPVERFSERREFGERAVGFLDLADHFADFYSARHVPSSGFALAVWLTEQGLSSRVHLAGFTAKRSTQWKVFHVHDWTTEQIVQRLLLRAGKLHAVGGGADALPLDRIARRFPGIDASDVSLVAADVLSERLEQANVAIDRLFSLTRFPARIDTLLRRLKPKTRKAKLAEARAAEAGTAKES
ncbi:MULTISPECIES: hypothetical protein [unclassified Aureimonas]|uniref:hypothetical protein n=1 Tax=unclassified Aureimonas TaxID=2615206 RepID=UPI0006F70917|nr:MULTISPECIES: hypothetical protein [unclassified Aureimonas]KQT59668.1 3-deoxy-manno-octulosonate cytidylyltransferase [Aureimonas sp. Leaf427]KQT63336.1 3-deoxy-manno-octulosonate cytidylyltransferase [Aureimonas sp. Leaf460]